MKKYSLLVEVNDWKNLNKIKEQFWEIKSKPRLFNQLFPEFAKKEREENIKHSHAYAIYIDDDHKTCIDGYAKLDMDDESAAAYIGCSTKFKKWIEFSKPKCFKDLLFILDMYNCDRKYQQLHNKNIQNPTFEPIPIVDEILAESKGFLLWNYQLENLYLLFHWYAGTGEVVSFRIDISGKRKAQTWNMTKGMKFKNGISLYDIIEDRMVNNYVKYPNLNGAYKLFKLLFG